jgi:hypothetical protein
LNVVVCAAAGAATLPARHAAINAFFMAISSIGCTERPWADAPSPTLWQLVCQGTGHIISILFK